MSDLHKLVSEKFTSGNSAEVEHITITRGEYEPALETLTEKPNWHHPDCAGNCFACTLDDFIKLYFGILGLEYVRRHLARTVEGRT